MRKWGPEGRGYSLSKVSQFKNEEARQSTAN